MKKSLSEMTLEELLELFPIFLSEHKACWSSWYAEEEKRISFNLGYTNVGFAEKVYHLHLRFMGDNDELYFRDYLNDNPAMANQYEELKLSLWKKYEHNRDSYTSAKGAFITHQTQNANEKYGSRY